MINTYKGTIGQELDTSQNQYEEYATSLSTAAYDSAQEEFQRYEGAKSLIIPRLENIEIGAGTNAVTKYTQYTEEFNTQLQFYQETLNYIKGRVNAALSSGSMTPKHQLEVEGQLTAIESDGEFFTDVQDIYETGTAEIILNYDPTRQFESAHKTFKNQMENIKDLGELNQFWDGYKALYAMAINTLDAMAQIALPSQTPAASAIYQYRNAIMSSASALNKRAASKRASMCSIGDGWLFWIIVLILLLILGGACFYYRREGKSTRRKSS